MKSLFLLSIVIAAVVIPVLAARDPNPLRGVKRMLFLLLVFNVVYLGYITMIHPVAFVPRW
jgi:hypothetical protein